MNAYTKNILRAIWGNKRRYLMLLLITALGAAFYLGLRSSAPDMRVTFDKYYDTQAMYDIRILSTYGLTGKHLDLLREVKGVWRVEPAYNVDLFAKYGDASYLCRFHSSGPGDPSAIPIVTEGRMPQNAGECAVSARFAVISRCSIGDRIELSTGSDEALSDFVARDTYTITGFIESPLYIRGDLGPSRKGSGALQAYAYIPFDDFTAEVYSEALVYISNPLGLSRFDDRFEKMSDEVEQELQLIGDDIVASRRDVLARRAIKAISGASLRLEASNEDFQRARERLRESELALAENERALLKGRSDLYERIARERSLWESGNAELMDARQSAERGRLVVEEGRGALERARSVMAFMSSAAGAAEELSDPSGELERARRALAATELEISARERELDAALSEIEDKQSALLINSDMLDAAWFEGLIQLSAAQAELSLARDALEDGLANLQAEMIAAQSLIVSSREAIADARRALQDMPEAKCYVLGLRKDANFESFRQDSDRISNIGKVFPLFFFLVAALVAFTSMVRIVEDDRPTAAVLQSLGYSSGRIFSKYIVFALMVGIPGAAIGIAVGHRLFPMIVFDYGYRILYDLPYAEKLLYPGLCALVGAISLVSVCVPAILVSVANMSQNPASLMRPKAPPPGKRVILERISAVWSIMNFSAKVTARNLLRYKKRFIMTVAGVAGCAAIVLTGFGLHDSVATVADKQFETIYYYDFMITVADGRADRSALERYLASLDEVNGWQYQRRENVDARLDAKGAVYEATLVIPDDELALPEFINISDWRTGEEIIPTESSVVITQKLASLLGISAGDEITLVNEDDEEWTVVARGVAKNYVGHYIYMTARHYAQLTGVQPEYTTIVGSAPGLTGDRKDAVSETLLENNGVVTLSFINRVREFYNDTLRVLNIVVVVLIVCGAILALVVLFCLTGINIDERKREIATLKVLGFFDGEASAYIFRENIVNTCVGSALGLALGIVLHQYVVRTVELDMIVFGKTIEPMSFVYSVALTFIFAIAVNAYMSRDIRDIDMIESLKSVD